MLSVATSEINITVPPLRNFLTNLQDSQAAELQQGSSLEKEEAQLRGLALELEALAAQLNQVMVRATLSSA